MKQKNLLDTISEDPGSIETTLSVILEMCEELRNGKTGDWENLNLIDFLESMHAWLEITGPRIKSQPSWKFLEIMLKTAKIYE